MRACRGGLRPWALAAMTAGLAAGLPALAQAAGATVVVGGGSERLALDDDAYFPSSAVVREGDSVTFEFRGFHTVTFLPRGQRPPRLVIPGTAMTAPTADPAGQPYWWGGATPALTIDPRVAAPTRARVVTGAAPVSSGFPDFRKPVFTARFPRAGRYRYVCLIHPLMRGEVRVVRAGAAVPTEAQAQARRARERTAVEAAGRQAARAGAARTGTAEILTGLGTGRYTLYRFFPRALTVKAGATVRFRWAGRNELHTVTFGPAPYVDALEKKLQGDSLGLPSEAVYASDPPAAGPAVVTPGAHGNGFVNSGLLFDRGSGPPPHAFTARFDTPGTYDYRCMPHSDTMKGRVTVVP